MTACGRRFFVQRIVGLAAVMDRRCGQRRAGFAEPEVVREVGPLHVCPQMAVFVEERFAQPAETEAATEAGRLTITGDDALEPLGCNLASNLRFQFAEDETAVPAVFFVSGEHRVAG